jgi:hypothetical protein
MKPWQQICTECGRPRERCLQVSIGIYVCRKCWRLLDYPVFMDVPGPEVAGYDPRALVRAGRTPSSVPQF